MSVSVHKASSVLPGGRLAFERAIRRSGLPAPARHVALTIATWADVATGVIPDRFQPSLSTLAEATGMGASTVKRHLGVLESEGWLLRDRPEVALARKEHARTKYALTVPNESVEHGPERAMPRPTAGQGIAQSGPTHGPERAKAGPTAGHKSSCSSEESQGSTPSSPAGPDDTEPPQAPDVTDGGGGGSDLRSTAEYIASRLDYLGQVPDRQQLERVTAALLAALTAGWSVEGLAVYLSLGTYRPDNPVAFYLSKLSPAKLPPAESLPATQAPGGHRPFEWPPDSAYGHGFGTGVGTDAKVSAWAGLTQQIRAREQRQGYQPFRNPVDQDVYDEPFPDPTRPPWCGDLDCNETDRMRDGEDDTGLPFVYRCPKCHPDAARAA